MTGVAASNQPGIPGRNDESSRSSTDGVSQTNQPSGQFDVLLSPVTIDRQKSDQGSAGDAKEREQSTKIDGTNRLSGRAFSKKSTADPAHVEHDLSNSLLSAWPTDRDTIALVRSVEAENSETPGVPKDLKSFATALSEFVASKGDQCEFQIGSPATGTVWVSLRTHEVGGVCIDLRTTDLRKQKQLDLHVPKLLASLRAHGINVISFTATFDNSLAGQSAPQNRTVIQPGVPNRKMSPIIPSTETAENEDAISSGPNIYTA